MLTDSHLELLLDRIRHLTIGVLGDLFLDRYLDLDAALTEPSLETGLDAYQIFRVRASPGAAGTIINNLVALGVPHVYPISVIGEDGEGYEVSRALEQMGVDLRWIVRTSERRTPTYTKPMLHRVGQPPRELNRLDIKNRTPLPSSLEDRVLNALAEVWPQVDALLVLDQVSEEDCGVITEKVRQRLAELADADSNRFVLADSRERIGLFRSVCLKPNERECRKVLGTPEGQPVDITEMARRAGRAVFCTRGAQGILLADPRSSGPPDIVPAFPVAGPIDIVGAGDSTSAGIACAVAAGLSLAEAAAFGNLVASITIQQIGTTGTATPDQVRQRWQEVRPSS